MVALLAAAALAQTPAATPLLPSTQGRHTDGETRYGKLLERVAVSSRSPWRTAARRAARGPF
ncbi:MAG: hypothetical protein AAF628_23295 [Planctomycetota bacterium]